MLKFEINFISLVLGQQRGGRLFLLRTVLKFDDNYFTICSHLIILRFKYWLGIYIFY